ncbi:unannotated protein [freshwater metagenome]|uniref:Unannotated protein n=1 Tax=freshwater metagenome TaxID=449393 RepID=A0A6J6ZFL5_9ZZZZ
MAHLLVLEEAQTAVQEAAKETASGASGVSFLSGSH